MEVVCNFLQKRCPLADFVQVSHAKIVDVHVQGLCNLEHDRLSDVHSLWTTKASERGVADCIRLADMTADPSMGNVIAVVDVSTSSVPIIVSISSHHFQGYPYMTAPLISNEAPALL
jgi:hypothetical protein